MRQEFGPAFAAVLDGSRVWVNGDEPPDGDATVLADGDEVAVLPPVSGGDGVDTGQLQALGLYDPDHEHAAERLELLEYLLGLGATLDDLVANKHELPVVASLVALRPGRERLTRAEVAARAGTSVEKAARIWRASGLPDPGPDDRVFSEADVDVVRIFLTGEELYGEDVALQLGRVVGSAVARVAEAARSAFIVHTASTPDVAGDPTGLALARANAEASALVPGVSRALDVVLRHHFELLRRPIELRSGERSSYDSQLLTVGFVDLVGSTALARELPIGALGAALNDFEAIASDALAERGGRLVKLVGDEVMFVTERPADACDVALVILDALAAHPDLPDGRGGLAAGEVLVWEGDYFGPVVNRAARIVHAAEPGTAVLSPQVARELPPERVKSLGTRSLRGFDDALELYRLEPAS